MYWTANYLVINFEMIGPTTIERQVSFQQKQALTRIKFTAK